MPAFEKALYEASENFDQRLDLEVANLLGKSNLKIAVAESLSGGLLSERLTRVPGSSKYFLGGIVCYSTLIKLQFCGVSPATLSQFGAVSSQVALEMATGIQNSFKADIGLSLTGYAGPDRQHPQNTGLVFLGVRFQKKQRVHPFRFEGDRSEIKAKAAQAAVVQLKQWLSFSDESIEVNELQISSVTDQ